MKDNQPDARILQRLYDVIESRKQADPSSSWTAKLLKGGPAVIGKKVGEEAVETVIAALAEDKEALTAESADLIYHLMVLWVSRGIAPAEVWRALEAREGKSGVAEKASRKK